MKYPPLHFIHQPIHVLGDHHGYTDELLDAIEQQDLRNAVILHVGDGEEGISCWREHFEALHAKFSKRNLLYFGMRGNHCNPSFFDGSVDLPYFKLVPDYTRLQTPTGSWLLVGGAISIDRVDRIPDFDWWPNETFQLRRELVSCADVLITHSGPRWIGPPSSNDFIDLYARSEEESTGGDLIADLETERMLHEELFRLVRPKHWYLGHFHRSEHIHHQGCEVRILNMNEIRRHTG